MPDLSSLQGKQIWMVGIKGAGMASLAVMLKKLQAYPEGSDIADYFVTQDQLEEQGITWVETFEPDVMPDSCCLLIHSTAYVPDNNPQIMKALQSRIPVFTYNDFIGWLSARTANCGCIAGTHGKTSTSAMMTHILTTARVMHYALYGASMQSGNISAVQAAETHLKHHGILPEAGIIEACEYKRHFLALSPSVALVTNIELDHPDFYCTLDSVADAFREFINRIRKGGILVYCADDLLLSGIARDIGRERPDIYLIPYGFTAEGMFGIKGYAAGIGVSATSTAWSIDGGSIPCSLRVPGRHMALNATGALAAAIALTEPGIAGETSPSSISSIARNFAACLSGYTGCNRRMEKLGEAGGIVVMDDYAHHPSEITAALTALREVYPSRRLVVDFMPHTFSRTKALFDDFVRSLSLADKVLVQSVFPSAREQGSDPSIMSRELAEKAGNAIFVESSSNAAEVAAGILQSGDLFISMGAGSNRETAEIVLDRLMEGE